MCASGRPGPVDPAAAQGADDKGPRYRVYVYAILRAIASTAVLVTVYFILPLNLASARAVITILVIGLLGLIVLVTFQVRWILVSRYPTLRAVEALATSVPLFLLIFAGTYFLMERDAASSFTQPMTRSDSLYFTVTVFSTVGFGDITAKSEAARRVVTAQIVADLVIVGAAIKAILGAISQARRQRDPLAGSGLHRVPPTGGPQPPG